MDNVENKGDNLELQLFVSGMSARSMQAINNIKQICTDHLVGKCNLEIIDIYKNPELASKYQIVFSPSLIKQYPLPRRTLIGTLSNKAKVMENLGIVSKK